MEWLGKYKKPLLIVGAVVLLFIAGFLLAKSEISVPKFVGGSYGVTTADRAEMSSIKGSFNINNAQYTDRKRPQNVNASLLVKDAEEAYHKILTVCEEVNGYEAASNMNLEGGKRYINVTLKVPPDSIPVLRDKLREIGKISNFSVSIDDITEQYIDTESRIRNLKNSEAQLNELMKRSDSIKDLLEVQTHLRNIRGELETLEGRMRAWDRLAAESTVNVRITEKEAPKALDDVEFSPLSLQTLKKQSVNGFIYTVNLLITILSWMVIIIATLLPVLILAGLAFLVVQLVFYRFRKRP